MNKQNHGVCSLPWLPVFALTWQRAGDHPVPPGASLEQPVPAMAGFITAHLGMNIFFRAPSAELI